MMPSTILSFADAARHVRPALAIAPPAIVPTPHCKFLTQKAPPCQRAHRSNLLVLVAVILACQSHPEHAPVILSAANDLADNQAEILRGAQNDLLSIIAPYLRMASRMASTFSGFMSSVRLLLEEMM